MRSVRLTVGMDIRRLPAGEICLPSPNKRGVMQQRLKAKHVQEVRALELNRRIQGTCFVQIISHLAHVEGTVTHYACLVILRVGCGEGILVRIALAYSRIKFLVARGSD